jgi:hypothetical protein
MASPGHLEVQVPEVSTSNVVDLMAALKKRLCCKVWELAGFG